jgi:hypothetical protein
VSAAVVTEEGCEILVCDKGTIYDELDDVLWIKLTVFIEKCKTAKNFSPYDQTEGIGRERYESKVNLFSCMTSYFGRAGIYHEMRSYLNGTIK